MRLNHCRFLVFVFVLFINYNAFAQAMIVREPVFRVPEEVATRLIGMRGSSGKVFVVSANGRYVRYDPESKETFKGRLPVHNLIDFDIILGQIVFLDIQGRLGGRLRKNWPDRTYEATAIEVCNEGLMLSGGDAALFLEKNATEPVKLENVHFALPVSNGFVYGFSIGKNKRWSVDLLDNYGNYMKQLFEFPPNYQPLGVNLGPSGPEGELLIAAHEKNERKLCSIGHNGHMFWKINIPEQKWQRDLAFDNSGNLLVLDKKGKEIWVYRWKMAIPEG